MIVGTLDFLTGITQYNTYIGGAGATVTTAALLAAKLSISEGNISNFTASNNNIKCNINADYTFNLNAFSSDHNITYYIDYDRHATSSASGPFYDTYNMKIGFFPAWASATGLMFRCASGTQESDFYALSIPLMTPIGSTNGADGNFVFTNVQNFYTHASNQTNNGGSPDGDLTQSGVNFTNINYVSGDTNAPDAIDDLASGTVSGSTVELTWSAPTSTNTIDLYVIFQDGTPIGSSTSTSFTVTGLTELTSYGFEVLTFDQEGNCSTFSNLLSETTLAYQIPVANIISYWNFDIDSLDQVGSNDGTDTSMSYVASGGIGNVADFTAGTTSKITVADDNSLSFGNSTTDSACSFLCRVKLSATTGVIQFIRKGAAATLREYVLRYNSGKLEMRFFDQSSGGYIEATFTVSLSAGTWYEFGGTYNGSGSQSGIEIYKDGALLAATKTLSGSYTAMENQSDPLVFGNISDNTTQALNGYMDETAIFDKELTALEFYEIYRKHQSGQYLTE